MCGVAPWRTEVSSLLFDHRRALEKGLWRLFRGSFEGRRQLRKSEGRRAGLLGKRSCLSQGEVGVARARGKLGSLQGS